MKPLLTTCQTFAAALYENVAMMQQNTANAYLHTRVMTASPQQLRMMLYDGAIKFCRQGRHGLVNKDFETMYTSISDAKKILAELTNSLDRKQDEQLVERMASVYNFMYLRLIDANVEKDPAIIDEVIGLLEYEKETWAMLMKKAEDGEGQADSPPAAAGATSAAGDAARSDVIGSIGTDQNENQPRLGSFSAQG
jgi:flagellar protein FliS